MDPVLVPQWIRGDEQGFMVSPRMHKLKILGLGPTPGTETTGLMADVVVVSSFDELNSKASEVSCWQVPILDKPYHTHTHTGEGYRWRTFFLYFKVPGKIVLFNYEFTDYESTVQYRVKGPAAASKLGAVGALVRSVTPFSIGSPHTGGTEFGEEDKPIPAAAVTLEDADLLSRLYLSGRKDEVIAPSARPLYYCPHCKFLRIVCRTESNGLPENARTPRHRSKVEKCSCRLPGWNATESVHDSVGSHRQLGRRSGRCRSKAT